MTSVQTLCPQCGAINRLPDSRLQDQPVCGKCKARLFQGKPVAVDDATFDRYRQHEELPLVVDFWAPWCGPCRSMAPVFERLAGQCEPRARFLKLNTEEAQSSAQRYQIRSIPTLMILRGGDIIAQQAGALPEGPLRQWLAEHGLA